MIGIYFSGIGNTKYCLDIFMSNYEENSKTISLENESLAIDEIKKSKKIILAYPIYYSNLPKIVRDFIENNKDIWNGKDIFIIATMGLFSGDGTGVSARLLKKYNANIIGGLHLKMPDCIADVKLLKRTYKENQEIIKKANEKIKISVDNLKSGYPTQEGLSFFNHIAGLFGQRLWFSKEVKDYSNKLKINQEACIGCTKCATICPMNNIEIKNKKAISKNKCTKCYRCINNCPQNAITLIGKEVVAKHNINEYIK